MQELNVQSSNPTPYTPAGGTYNNNPIPGAGGLPSLSGLSNRMNPMAQELQNQGRGEDSVLVHMTPGEVNSLRGLAQKFGGDLTTNPNTGLPEAGWLGKLLPTLIGAAGMLIPGAAPWMIAAGVGVGQTALTGDLNKGLMAGLQAFGGASLAGAAGVGGGAGTTLTPAAETAGGVVAPTAPASAVSAALPPPVAEGLAGAPGLQLPGMPANVGGATLAAQVPGMAPAALAPTTAAIAPPAGATPGFFSKFGTAAREGMPKGMLTKYAPIAAGMGTLSAVSDVTAPDLKTYEGEEDKWKYEGPYYPMPRRISPRATGPEGMGEIQFFDVTNPVGYLTASGERRGYAEGGDTTDTSKMAHKDLISRGYVDPKTGERSQLQAGVTPEMAGMISSLGGNNFIVNKQGQWEAYTPPAPAPAATTPAPATTSARLGLTGLPAITPTATNTTTRVTDTSTPTRNTETVRTTTSTPSGPTSTGPAPSGFGVQTLGQTYTPNFASRDDFITERATPYTLGSQMSAALPGLTSQFQTSPGAITASRTYPGGSPSERIRAAAQANAAKPTNEIDFGLPKTTAINSSAFTASGLPDFTKMSPQDIYNYYSRSTSVAPPYAKGGEIHMDDGSFVVDARTVSELGNGSSNAGIEFLERLGGRAVRGPGDGVSDSVPANIGGEQEARVARDEVIFPAAMVKRLGGAKKLYALMDKAHKARKKAKRGQDTKVAKGLGALA